MKDLQSRFKSGDTVEPEKLKEIGLVKGKRAVKILGDGEIKKKLNVSGCKLSATAREKIEKAGGEIKK